MDEEIKLISERLKGLRDVLEISVEEMAETYGCETEKYIEGEIFYFSIDKICFSIYNVIMMRALLP